ncbi:MAG TPA: hypothetical protein PKA82_00135 [Pyrinomonadaceae bacterium]|nr:hypothetical protein [Pyrinomonadaceae bacterium]
MKFESGIDEKYRQSVTDAFATIMAKGNDHHRHVMNEIAESDLLIRVQPVSEINASGVTGVISTVSTNFLLATERLSLREALGEIYIAIAEETIDTGGQRGCEGTLVHEGQHAFDFAQTLESLSNKDMNLLGQFNPTLYELELAAHKTSAEYMMCINTPEYTDEGKDLMILCSVDGGGCAVSADGIERRLNESYGLFARDRDDGNCSVVHAA